MANVLTLRQRIILIMIAICTVLLIVGIFSTAAVDAANAQYRGTLEAANNSMERGNQDSWQSSGWQRMDGVPLVCGTFFVGYTDIFLIVVLIIISIGRFLENRALEK